MKHLFVSFAVALAAMTGGVHAQSSDYISVTGISGWSETDTSHVAAIKLRLAPEWKTYWRSPGASGIPPQFEWDNSTNVTAVSVDWPQPKVFYAGGARSIGYSDDVIIPLHITKGKGTAALSGTVSLGVCKDVCVPVSVPIHIPLTDTGPQDDVIAAIQSGPREVRSTATCTMTPVTGGFEVTVSAKLPRMADKEITVLEMSNPNIWVSDTDTTRTGNKITATADFISMTATPVAFDRSDLRLTVFGGDDMAEMRGCTAG